MHTIIHVVIPSKYITQIQNPMKNTDMKGQDKERMSVNEGFLLAMLFM